ncbi:MAG TPA: N-acetylglucosamine-6-phosphate deacetylase [Firmicutes bacterium]|nr:N-acetylglucosamine-6-phosphate deacetylase [Bacillota bacterium]
MFTHVRLVTPERVREDRAVLVRGSRIAGVYPAQAAPAADARVVDGKGRYLAPGFIDIHCHGGGGHDFMDATPQAFIGAAETHARTGTATLLPTTLAGDDEDLRQTFEAFRQVKQTGCRGANMPGLHLEGPYFSAEYKGAQDEKYLRCPRPADYRRIAAWADGAILRWSAAPELPGAGEFFTFLREEGIVPSIAHTSAAYDDVLEAYENGCRLITHLYSGMSTITRVRGFRVPGVVESAYLIEGMRAELIADGCHLPAPLLRLAYKGKGAENLVLVTDAMRGAGMPEGESILGSRRRGQRVVVENGVAYMPDRSCFAGSVCTADRLVRTMVQQAGVPLCEAVRMITATPAAAMGWRRKGAVAAGMDADLVLFDEAIHVSLTMAEGRIVYQEEEGKESRA